MTRKSARLLRARANFMRSVIVSSGVLVALPGCRAPAPMAAIEETPAECPESLRGQLRVSASALPISLPEELSVEPGSARPQELLARRLLLAASPAGTAAGTSITGSMLTITVVGGTFGGWISAPGGPDHKGAARLAMPRELFHNRALEVIPGQLRITPFFASTRMGAQTLALDVTVVPGGVPRSRAITSLSPLWTAAGQPVAPADIAVTVTTGQHLTIFSAVEAQVQLVVEGLSRSDSPRPAWRCSYLSRFTLLDHASVLPSLWTLQLSGNPLALSAPATGPFRAVFSDPAAAQSFATWLRATGATGAGGYQLGLFEAGDQPEDSTIPADSGLAHTFRSATSNELRMLTVRRLGEE